MKTTHNHQHHPTTHLLSLAGSVAISLAAFAASSASAQNYGSAFRTGSTGGDVGTAIARDSAGNHYVCGNFNGTADLDPGTGTASLTSAGAADAFLAKYDSFGTLLWARRMGGVSTDAVTGVAVDASGNVCITGYYYGSAKFGEGGGAQAPFTATLTSAGGADSFVCKFSSTGGLLWARSMGGTVNDFARCITVTADGGVVTAGSFSGTADFNPATGSAVFNLTSAGYDDIFVSRLDANGNFVWAKRVGSTGADVALAITPDTATPNAVCLAGGFSGTTDFDPDAGVASLTSAGSNDVFVLKLSSTGSYIWARRMGSTSMDVAYGIAVDPAGNVLTTGFFSGSADFDPGAGTATLAIAGGTDIFLSKLSSTGIHIWARSIGGTGNDAASSLVVDAAGNACFTGTFSGVVDFNPGLGTTTLSSAGTTAAFVCRFKEDGELGWAKRFTGSGADVIGSALAVDSAGANVWSTGHFSSTADFDPGTDTANLTSAGGTDVFVSRLTLNSKVLWSNAKDNAALWTVDGYGDMISSKNYTLAGFTATSYDRSGEEGNGRILWSNAVQGQARLWTLNRADDFVSEATLSLPPGWTASSYRASADGSGRILMTHTDGSTQVLIVDAKGRIVTGTEMSAAPGWTVKAYTP